ncbi:MAG TPA: ABC transporter ATP-binding protein [Pyrinomonadaceae bacterium]|nr:ABC transporter ATP-binding protein [Pyrinomonadaceae bacterium]
MSEPILEARRVTKLYRVGNSEVAALDGVSVMVDKGEFVAIRGASGSGKSTLLNLLGGLDQPSSGQVCFEGRVLDTLDKEQLADYRRHSVGMIFQNFNLIPTMTAAENVALALAFGGVRGGERAKRTSELLGRVGLGDRMMHRPSELSGGEQQRVAIARALANSPRLLLADEPTGNLDTTRSREILALLRELVESDGLTVLMVTHDNELAARFADRTILMEDGRVLTVEQAVAHSFEPLYN